jgi:hypothetical protein
MESNFDCEDGVMPGTFDDSGFRFLYPENWQLERTTTEDGWSVSVQSPATAFLLLTVDENDPAPEDMLRTALDALKADYPDLEFEDCVDSLAGLPALGHNIRFTSLDLTNTCWTRSFCCEAGTVMVLCQCNDLESDLNEAVLRAICASLTVGD